MLQLVSTASCPIAAHPQEEFGSIFSSPSHLVVANCNKAPLRPSLLQTQQAQLAQPPPHTLCAPAPGPSWWIHSSMFMCLLLKSPELDPGPKVCLTSAEQREGTISLDLQAMSLLMQPRTLLVFLAAMAHCWLVANFSTRTFSAVQLANDHHGIPKPQPWGYSCQEPGFVFAFVSLHDVPMSWFLQPVELLCTQPSPPA